MRSSVLSSRIGLGLSPTPRSGLALLPIGAALGPAGLNILSVRVLDSLDPAVSVALATLGVAAGLGLDFRRPREGRLLAAASLEAGVTILVVGAAAVAVLARFSPLEASAWVALMFGISAAVSAATISDDPDPGAQAAARVSELNDVLPIVLGALVLASLHQAGLTSGLALGAQATVIAFLIALAGRLLVERSAEASEQHVFVAGALLLLGGTAAYLSMSALWIGLVGGLTWKLTGGAALDRIERDLRYVQHPLIVLLLVVAGARLEISTFVLGGAALYVVCRVAGKIAGTALARWTLLPDLPADTGRRLIAPGVIALAFGLNVLQARPDWDLAHVLLAVAAIGSVASELLAVVAVLAAEAVVKRLAAVALVVSAVIWTRLLAPGGATEPAGTALALGFTLIAAMVTGDLLRRFHLPRLTGYLLFGLVFGPYLGNVISEPMARQLQMVNGLATTLIAFIAGLAINFERLGGRAAAIARMTAVTLAVAMAGLFAAAWIAWPWLPVAPEAAGMAKLAMIALFVVIVISFSPTMTAAVISETGARGRLSELVLAMVVLADLVVLVLFSLLMQGARLAVGDGDASEVNVLVRLAWEMGGAVAFGSLVGALFALYLRYVAREIPIVLVALCVLLSQVGATQGFEPLLAAMAAGLVIENLAVAQGDALKMALQRGALPVLVVFFVATGASLRLDALATTGAVTVALVALRIALIRLGVAAGLRASNVERRTGSYAWTGLISQAGITLGLASVLATEFPTWGGQVQMLLVALIAVDELVGPAMFRSAWRGPASSMRARRGRSSSSPTASRTCTTTTRRAGSSCRRRPAASPSRSTR